MAKTEEGNLATRNMGSEAAACKVGYGRPPVASRFPRGTSGNPLGRPKRQRGKVTFAGAMRELLMSDVTVVAEGQRRRMLRIEALADALIATAIEGNTSAARLVLDLAHRFVPPNETIAHMHEQARKPADSRSGKPHQTLGRSPTRNAAG